MEAAKTHCLTPPRVDTVDASPHGGSDGSLQLADRLPASIVAKRRVWKANSSDSPVRRSPRLSCLPPPKPPDTRHADEPSDDESENLIDASLQFSREETPENDRLWPDEPSTVLADRVIRAQDNPSPPPQDVTCLGDRFLLPEVSAPPSPFRPINFLERLNQLSFLPFDFSRSHRTQALDDRPEVPGYSTPHSDSILRASCSPSNPVESIPREDMGFNDTTPLSFTQCTFGGLPSQSLQQGGRPNLTENPGVVSSSNPVTGIRQRSTAETSSRDPDVSGPSSVCAVERSSSPVASLTLDDYPRGPMSHSEQQDDPQSLPLIPNANAPLIPPLNKNGRLSPPTETVITCGQDGDEKEKVFTGNSGPSALKKVDENESGATSAKEIIAHSQQGLESLSSHSTDVLDGLCLPSESSIEQTGSPGSSLSFQPLSSIPPRTSGPSVIHPGISRLVVQHPVFAPTPIRLNKGAHELDSPVKFSFEVDDIHRTPARRVPFETALAHATPTFQKSMQLPVGTEEFQPGRFLIMKTPVFTRPALNDASRSPAKRVPITDLVASPTRGQRLSPPVRLSLRSRSTSVEPRPLGHISARSRSVEPSATISKPDNHGKTKEFIFPAIHVLPRSTIKLPFPLASSHKLSGDQPPSIPEEYETTNMGANETSVKTMPGTVKQAHTMSQLRQQPASSRIPRIGNKPYARLIPKNGKSTVGTMPRNTTSSFQPTKDNGIHTEAPIKPPDDQRPTGSLKRKRGTEMMATSTSRSIMIRQVVPGILNGKYAPKPTKSSSHIPEASPPKAPQPLKFRKVVDGMLSARYTPVKTNPPTEESVKYISPPPSPLSELSSSSNEGPDERPPVAGDPSMRPKTETRDTPRTDDNTTVAEPTCKHTSLHQDGGGDEFSSRLRRTSRSRKPAQQQYVLDVFNSSAPTRPPPPRRKPRSHSEGDGFMGMSATALKALTATNTAKNQQTVAVLATEVIRKEGLRPESPTVKARTILQKQRDERDMRRKERSQKRAQMNGESLGISIAEEQAELEDQSSHDTPADYDDNDYMVPTKHRRGPGDEEEYETPERPERVIEPLRLEGVDRKVKPIKQVKWDRGLSTAVYLDEVDPRPKSTSREVRARGCLAPTSKNIPLDHLGNLANNDNRSSPDITVEKIVVKRYLYDNDVEPEPMPAKTTRSKSKKRS